MVSEPILDLFVVCCGDLPYLGNPLLLIPPSSLFRPGREGASQILIQHKRKMHIIKPDEKSGGHGVGWSPIIPYTFSVPQEWEEVPVSIADLGGTELDLRFSSSKEGRLFVIVAPVLRFSDELGDNATIEKIGPPDKVISAFGPEMIGENVEGKVLSSSVAEHEGRTYYKFELEPPHIFITATAAGNRLYLFGVTGNGLQWKRHYNDLKKISDSFRVV
ncbi:psbP domain-containing protein 4 chloroplastic-like [Trifolium pratense]|uniref:PsbP domain-containing protein 4 chloroplastic-like n=1 Tax=Trifolium pratense TaxID=57577 RepID=A0A2K3PJP9_TRIPR|nr:psbP domain-containing protein 4 chloroplastic-like [Trifolium pratense]